MEEKFDALIIGSGAGGLTTAICLAKHGKKVLVLERHYVPGGWCHSFQLNGQRFSPGVHYIGQLGPEGKTRQMFEELEIADELTFFKMKHVGYEHVHVGGSTFDYPASKKEFVDALCAAFPAEAEGIRKYLQYVYKTQQFLDELVECETGMAKLGVFLRSPGVLRHAFSTLEKVVNKYIKDPQLKAVMNAQWGNHGVLPKEASFLYHCGVVNHYSDGGFYPMGGGGALVKAMTNTLKKYGGLVRTQTTVDHILLNGKKAVGVQLESGEKLYAHTIISNADPHTTYTKLLPKDSISKRLAKKLEKTKYSYSSVLLFLTLDIDPKAYGLDSGNYWMSESSDLNALIANQSLPDLLQKEKFPMAFVSSSTLKDPASYDGMHFNMEVVTFVELGLFDAAEKTHAADYHQVKQRLAEMILNNLEQLIPDVREHIVQMEIGTPKTNKRYINSTGGHVYGTHKTIQQLGPGAFKHKAEIAQLYLCGASTFSHGIAGAMNSGINTAKLILQMTREELFRNAQKQSLKVYNADEPESFPAQIQAKIQRRSERSKAIERSDFLKHQDPNHSVSDAG
jgi:phytoene desaturase